MCCSSSYASLYPLEGWRDAGRFAVRVPQRALAALRHRASTWSVNVLGYVPFGFLAVAALQPRVRGVAAFVAGGCVGAALLSLMLEAAPELPAGALRRPTSTCCATWPAPRSAPRSAVRFAPLHRRRSARAPARSALSCRAPAIDFGLVLIGAVAVHPAQPGDAALRRRRPARLPRRRARARARRPEFFVIIEAFTAGGQPGRGRRCCSRRSPRPGRPVRAMLAGAGRSRRWRSRPRRSRS